MIGIMLCVYYFDFQISPKNIGIYFNEIDCVYNNYDNEIRAASADGLNGRKYADVQRA